MIQKLFKIIENANSNEILNYALLTKDSLVVMNKEVLIIHKPNIIFPNLDLSIIGDDRLLMSSHCLKNMNTYRKYKIRKYENEYFIYFSDIYDIHYLKDEKLMINKFPSYVYNEYIEYDLNITGVNPDFLLILKDAIDPNATGISLKLSSISNYLRLYVTGSRINKDDYICIIKPILLQHL